MTKLVTSNFITKVQNFEKFDKIPVDSTRAYDVEYPILTHTKWNRKWIFPFPNEGLKIVKLDLHCTSSYNAAKGDFARFYLKSTHIKKGEANYNS